MRTVIVGDLQYKAFEDIGHIINDIASLNADNVILLGDYGNCDNLEKLEEFKKIAIPFRDLKVENFVPILGNHDVQHEIMGISNAGTAKNYLKEAFKVEDENVFLEFGDMAIFCMGCECPPEKNHYSDHECYLSERTVNMFKKKLLDNREKAVIVVTHAPPSCSGLLNKPDVHLRASNAFLNQDHNYFIFKEIIGENPQIKAWFSGHYHIGHYHIGSISKYLNTYFFLTGAPTSAARDGQHHSHVLDFVNNEFLITTYDHDKRKLGEFENINNLRAEKNYCFVGSGENSKNYIYEAPNGHVFVMTKDSLWEINVDDNICLGTIHCSNNYKMDDFFVDEEYVWRVCGKKKFGHKLEDQRRFMRDYDYDRCVFIEEKFDGKIDNRYKVYSQGDGWYKLRNRIAIKLFNDENNYLCMTKKTP